VIDLVEAMPIEAIVVTRLGEQPTVTLAASDHTPAQSWAMGCAPTTSPPQETEFQRAQTAAKADLLLRQPGSREITGKPVT